MIIHEYELADDLPVGQAIDIVEDRGRIVYKIASHLAPEQIISALNEGAAAVLAGGHWFQEWKGDIVAADPSQRQPEPGSVPAPRLGDGDEATLTD
ncbi:hypothetical protein P3T35_003118 [Kitasatospora sp. GP30]|uniref:hypothetical protein n=1 Tax=Kitasatospora sp. GP30 TaxID=3035084 RepID=UPI000C6FFC0E|nr:hypothetical protein [Kitasatospora sp. GP30]MDH6141105.1 hypothetical protein [Kitasatospora sp. GP30]